MSYRPTMTREERDAWFEGLTPSQKALVGVPTGWMCTLVVIADIKRVLQDEDLPSEERLYILEKINSFADGQWLTQEMLAAIKPPSPVGAEMYRTICEMVKGKGGAGVALDLLAEIETFDLFCKDNPSLLAALKIKQRADSSHAAA